MAYKQDQGRMARMAAFWTLAILIFYGCISLRAELAGRFQETFGALLWEGGRIPILGVDVTGALLVAVVIFAGAMTLLYRWTESPKIADALIETESELRKVTWPTLNEAINSSIVVIVTVLVLMAILAGADVVLGWWAGKVLTGGAA
jgi:preprotein translocase subunit SecE